MTTIIVMCVLIVIAFVFGYAFGSIDSYNNGYKDASDIYTTPEWKYKRKVTRKK